jgi:mono/diheme cytochrome c family protein
MRAGTLLFAALSACVALTAAYAAIELPDGPNRALVYGQCRTCHDLQYLKESAGITRDDWDQLLISMKQYGLRLEPDQRAKILDYLGTYLGPNPPPKMAAAAAPAAVAAKVDGAAVFKDQCTACHQENAQGLPEQFPPLAKNADLFLSPDYPVRVVLFGLEGKIEVNGKKFDSAMPPLDVLSDQEIAAVVNYVRGHFGNAALAPKNLKPVDASVVAKLRGKKGTTAAHVYDYRQKLKGGGH